MPILRRKLKQEIISDGTLTKFREDKLTTGIWWKWLNNPGDEGLSDEALRQLWEMHRETVLANFFYSNQYAMHKIHTRRGCIDPYGKMRPWAFWVFDAPEPRRILTLRNEEDIGDWELLDPEKQHSSCRTWEAMDIATIETEFDYLLRLGLLTDAEKATLSTLTVEPRRGPCPLSSGSFPRAGRGTRPYPFEKES
jgi:hypothetical protein